jgi:hypothetical protein
MNIRSRKAHLKNVFSTLLYILKNVNILTYWPRCDQNYHRISTPCIGMKNYQNWSMRADWKVLRLFLFLFPGIRLSNAVLGFVKVIHWRVWTCSWTAVAFSIWSQRVEAPSTFCHGRWGRRLCENTAEVWLIDKARSGRPSTAVTDVSIAKAVELLENDRRLLLRELSTSLNMSFEHKRHENPFAWSHEEEKTGFAQGTVVFAPG